GADDTQATRQLGEREESLVGQVADAVEAGDRRRRGARSGGDDGAAEAQRLLAHPQSIGTGEGRLPEEDVDTEVAKARRRVDTADVGAQATHPLHGGGEID